MTFPWIKKNSMFVTFSTLIGSVFHLNSGLIRVVMVHSLRRPAAVQEATLAEYQRGSWETVEGAQAFVVPVAKHKTMVHRN